MRVCLIDRFSPRSVFPMAYLLAGSASVCNHITRGFMQAFPSSIVFQLPQTTDPVSSYFLFNSGNAAMILSNSANRFGNNVLNSSPR